MSGARQSIERGGRQSTLRKCRVARRGAEVARADRKKKSRGEFSALLLVFEKTPGYTGGAIKGFSKNKAGELQASPKKQGIEKD